MKSRLALNVPSSYLNLLNAGVLGMPHQLAFVLYLFPLGFWDRVSVALARFCHLSAVHYHTWLLIIVLSDNLTVLQADLRPLGTSDPYALASFSWNYRQMSIHPATRFLLKGTLKISSFRPFT